jgi:bifunctional non-homologous end joining protein LigD
VRTAKVKLDDGTVRPRLIGGDLATLLYTIQIGAISAHPWQSRVGSLGTPDALVIDLDPAPDAPFDRVVSVALAVREALAALGLEGHPKTSGASGLHVVVPYARRTTWKATAATAEAVAKAVAAATPGLTTLARSPARRPPGTVYVDFLQNARGKTVASAWSVRATATATVSTPLAWSEVKPGLDPTRFTIAAALERLARPDAHP